MPDGERARPDIICFKDDKVQCFNDSKVRLLRAGLCRVEEHARLARQFKALGHPLRLAIIELLSVEECCVCDLANVLEQPVSTLSQHLKTLRLAGLVRSRQSGRFVHYSLSEPGLTRAAELIEAPEQLTEEAR